MRVFTPSSIPSQLPSVKALDTIAQVPHSARSHELAGQGGEDLQQHLDETLSSIGACSNVTVFSLLGCAPLVLVMRVGVTGRSSRAAIWTRSFIFMLWMSAKSKSCELEPSDPFLAASLLDFAACLLDFAACKI